MLLIFSLLFVSAGLAHAQGEGTDDTEFDFYDAGNLHEFIINCGSVDSPFMRITYGGAAYRMYAESNPDGCQAVEMAPAVWQIYIEDYETTECPVVADNMGDIGDTSLWKLNVVVQRGMVRKIDDPYKQIICNYGLGGKTDTNQTGIAGEAELDPIWRNTNTHLTDEIVDLYVYDTSNNRVDSVTTGDYIQLRAYLQSGDGELENSIRVFNCRAFAEDYTSYYFMLEGCGKGDGVMPADRGFRTRYEDTGNSKITRVSRSSYFKSFALPGHEELTFECHYILCSPDQCDGYSCPDSVMVSSNQSRAEPLSPSTRDSPEVAAARRKRDVSAPTSKYDQLPKIRSNKITLLQPEEPEILLRAEDLIFGRSERSQDERPRGPYAVPKSSRSTKRMNYEPEVVEVREQEPVMEEGLDLITIGLIAGMAFLALLLLITLVCTYVVCHRSMKPHYRTERTEQLLYPKSTGHC